MPKTALPKSPAFQTSTLVEINELLVGGISTPLKNMSSSVGMMKFPTEWKVIKIHGSKPPTRLLFYQHYPLVNIPKIAGKSTHFING